MVTSVTRVSEVLALKVRKSNPLKRSERFSKNMERQIYYDFKNLTPTDYLRIYKTRDTRAMSVIAQRIGFAFGSGIAKIGVAIPEKIAEEVR